MPAIASLEDLKAAQKDLHEARDLTELKTAQGITICDSIPQSAFRIWKAPEQLKGEASEWMIKCQKTDYWFPLNISSDRYWGNKHGDGKQTRGRS